MGVDYWILGVVRLRCLGGLGGSGGLKRWRLGGSVGGRGERIEREERRRIESWRCVEGEAWLEE